MNDEIYYMAEDNKLDEMKKIIDSGENLNQKNEDGWTLLHLAISREHEEMALMLLEHGTDPSIQDNNGDTALHYAAGNNMYAVAEIILKKNPKIIHIENNNTAQPLYKAVHNAEIPMIKLLLENGADKDHGEGGSPFGLAKKYELEEYIRVFDGY